VHKSLSFYYIAILWIVGVISVFLIVRPLVISMNEKNGFSDLSDISSANENKTIEKNSSGGLQNVTDVKLNDSGDLIFYDKTAFIRYFGDKYSEEELANSYDKAVAGKSDKNGKALIRVSRKTGVEKTKKSFSGSFDIRPVPVNKN